MRRADQAKLSHPALDERRQRIIHPRFAAHWLELLARHQGQGKQSGAGVTGKNDIFHRTDSKCATQCHSVSGLFAGRGPSADCLPRVKPLARLVGEAVSTLRRHRNDIINVSKLNQCLHACCGTAGECGQFFCHEVSSSIGTPRLNVPNSPSCFKIRIPR